MSITVYFWEMVLCAVMGGLCVYWKNKINHKK